MHNTALLTLISTFLFGAGFTVAVMVIRHMIATRHHAMITALLGRSAGDDA